MQSVSLFCTSHVESQQVSHSHNTFNNTVEIETVYLHTHTHTLVILGRNIQKE